MAHPGRRGDARQGGDRRMSESPSKLQERLLSLISPICLLLVWQILIQAGFGDRRFVPAPSDVAVRFWELTTKCDLPDDVALHFWGFAIRCELPNHTAATVLRGVAGCVL